MSDEKSESKQVTESADSTPKETPKTDVPQEKPSSGKLVELRESFANKAGDQGVSFNPSVGSNTPDPFVSQDTNSSPAQTIVSTQPPENSTPTTSSRSEDTSSGE